MAKKETIRQIDAAKAELVQWFKDLTLATIGLEAPDARLPLTAVSDARPKAVQTTFDVFDSPGVEPWRGAFSTEFQVDVTIPETPPLKDKSRDLANLISREFIDWLKLRGTKENPLIGVKDATGNLQALTGMKPYRELPIVSEINARENNDTGVILSIVFHLCEQYPNGGGGA